MSEEDKQEIEASFRAMFNEIKDQLRSEREWDNYMIVPENTASIDTLEKMYKELEMRNREPITTDEIIEFSQNLLKLKGLNGKEDVENKSSRRGKEDSKGEREVPMPEVPED